jgi:pantoate--beta-alanine ligase
VTALQQRVPGPALVILRSLAALRPQIASWRLQEETLGLVPTMGALHAGHMALIEAARRECDRVAVTIFVNPLQFNKPADLACYPRREAEDIAKLEAAGVDLLYAPLAADIYPEGFCTSVSVAGLTDCLCGAARPGHMTAVATVVAKLLLQALPNAAYFGEKDYQQLLVVQRMAKDLDMPLSVVAVPTLRDADGLALSSRNANLSPTQRALAPQLYRRLDDLAEELSDGRPAAAPLAAARADLLDAGFTAVDYVELRAEGSLATLEAAEVPARVFAAVCLGEVRLIDNVKLL